MIEIDVALGARSYPIFIGSGVIDRAGQELARLNATRVLVVTNTTVGPLYGERVLESIRRALPGVPAAMVQLPDGEQFKDLDHVRLILDAAVDCGLDRRSFMVALGGGVVGDMTGFAASMWMRGIGFMQIPTTVLSQVDSSVGGKTGVNLPAGKNLIGAFHQPSSVLVDPDVLKTLDARQVSAGIAEVVKYGFLGDARFVETLERSMHALRALDAGTVSEVVAHCCRMKADIVHRDERETGERAKLNLGHTFGHAIEKETGFSRWLHGEAVAAGTVMAAVLSRRLGYLSEGDVDRIRSLVTAAGLPARIGGISAQRAWEAMLGDKKSLGGVVRFVVMRAIGESAVERVPQPLVLETMRECGWS